MGNPAAGREVPPGPVRRTWPALDSAGRSSGVGRRPCPAGGGLRSSSLMDIADRPGCFAPGQRTTPGARYSRPARSEGDFPGCSSECLLARIVGIPFIPRMARRAPTISCGLEDRQELEWMDGSPQHNSAYPKGDASVPSCEISNHYNGSGFWFGRSRGSSGRRSKRT